MQSRELDEAEFRKLLEDKDFKPKGPLWDRIWRFNPKLRDEMKKYGKYYKMKQKNPNNKKLMVVPKMTPIEDEIYDFEGNMVILMDKFDFIEPNIKFIRDLKVNLLDVSPNIKANIHFLLTYLESLNMIEPDYSYMRLSSSTQNLILILNNDKDFPVKYNWKQNALEHGFIIYRFDLEEEKRMICC
jgi:hypothetical protein